jgi:hypothetical protein
VENALKDGLLSSCFPYFIDAIVLSIRLGSDPTSLPASCGHHVT